MARGISGFNTAEAGNDHGAPLVVFSVQTVSGTSSYTLFKGINSSEHYRVVDVVCYATAAGGSSDTVTVRNGSTAITDAMDLNVSDKVVVRAGTIDDAERDIGLGDSLVVVTASDAVAYVQVFCTRV